MIRYALREPIQRVKGVTCVWRRHDPFMMRFMQRLVDHRMMQASVYPIDEKVGKADEEGELKDVV